MSDHCNGANGKLVTLGARRAPEYWQSPEELRDGVRNRGEFPGGLPSPAELARPASEPTDGNDSDTTRRDFLTLMGFGVSAATMAACRAPEQRAVPLPVAAETMVA